MTEAEQSLIKQVHVLLVACISVIIFEGVASLLLNSAHYLFTVLAAIIVALVQWLYWHKKGDSAFRKYFVLVIFALTLFSPILIFLFKVFILNVPVLGVDIFLICLYAIPIVILFYVDFRLRRLLNQS